MLCISAHIGPDGQTGEPGRAGTQADRARGHADKPSRAGTRACQARALTEHADKRAAKPDRRARGQVGNWAGQAGTDASRRITQAATPTTAGLAGKDGRHDGQPAWTNGDEQRHSDRPKKLPKGGSAGGIKTEAGTTSGTAAGLGLIDSSRHCGASGGGGVA